MKKDTHITEVIFRIDTTGDFKGDVIAIMPHIAENNGCVSLYVHNGQHFSGKYQVVLATSRLAKPSEYADLKAEMERGYGYNFKVIKKQNYTKFLASYNESRK